MASGWLGFDYERVDSTSPLARQVERLDVRLDLLAAPLEHFDERLTDLFAGAPLLVALGIALAIGLRHASDPDHLVAVTSLIVRDDGDMRLAARIGAFWGIGHAVTLVVLGTPLIVFKSALPAWLERGAETGVGLIILALAVRIVWRWARGDYRVGRHRHDAPVAGVHEGTPRPRARWRRSGPWPPGRPQSPAGTLHWGTSWTRGHRCCCPLADCRTTWPARGPPSRSSCSL